MEQKVKDLKYYQRLPYTLHLEKIIDGEEKYFTAEFLELRGCKTDGVNEVEAVHNLHELFDEYIESQIEEGIAISEPEKVIISVTPVIATLIEKKEMTNNTAEVTSWRKKEDTKITNDSEETLLKVKHQYNQEINASIELEAA